MHFARLVKEASADRVLRHISLLMTLHILACMLIYTYLGRNVTRKVKIGMKNCYQYYNPYLYCSKVTCDRPNLTEIPEEVGTWQISVLQMSHNKNHSLKTGQ